jgi:hypothetical protein
MEVADVEDSRAARYRLGQTAGLRICLLCEITSYGIAINCVPKSVLIQRPCQARCCPPRVTSCAPRGRPSGRAGPAFATGRHVENNVEMRRRIYKVIIRFTQSVYSVTSPLCSASRPFTNSRDGGRLPSAFSGSAETCRGPASRHAQPRARTMMEVELQ